jgi:DNA repair exonuclease SbcCD nuclease subunit
MKFLLCSDLHLSTSEKDYALSVLREVIALCGEENCGALLFAGDVFDSWADTEALRDDFRVSLEALPRGCAVYYLPGNHEELRAPGGSALESFDFGRANLLSQKPFVLIPQFSAEAELLAVPFQKEYSGYREWGVPPKEKRLRILLAHGTVPGIAYTGPREEDADSVLDEELFAYFDAGLAAMGHLHGYAENRKGQTLVAYPGSARVWREGELGPRRVLLGSTETVPPRLEAKTLKSAGEYRVVTVYASPGGELQYEEPEGLSPSDFLVLVVSGVVEDESSVTEELEKLKTGLEKKCRKLTIRKNLSVLAGVTDHPLARNFLHGWEKAAARYADKEAYGLARIKGLVILKEILEGRK